MLDNCKPPAPWRLGAAFAGTCVALCLAATCCPRPAPATQDDPPAEAAAVDEAAVPDIPGDPAPDTAADTPSPTQEDPLEADAPDPGQPTSEEPDDPAPPVYPDMTRALETGMPVSNGVSSNPASVLLNVASYVSASHGAPAAVGVNEATGRVIYA